MKNLSHEVEMENETWVNTFFIEAVMLAHSLTYILWSISLFFFYGKEIICGLFLCQHDELQRVEYATFQINLS